MEQVESGSGASNLIEEAVERLVLENSALRVTILPSLGGKIASIQLMPDGEELLQQPLQPYAARTRYMSFDSSDASGWDECLPSVAACEVQTANGVAQIPDHGDFWQVAWKVVAQSGNELTISADGFTLPLRFIRTLRLDGTRLHIAYTVENPSSEAVEYIWSAHPLFAVEAGDRIILPASVREVIVEGSAQNRLGERGTKQAWPHATLKNQEMADLTVAGKITDGIGDKLFTVAPREGWCAIERKRLQRRVELRFDAQELPWLGLWICYGGWPEHYANRQQCVALEPCTAEGDSLAKAAEQGRACRLAPAAEDRWSLELNVGGVS